MTWHTGFPTYLQSYEVRLYRRSRTFGGVVWPDPTPGLIGPQRLLRIALAVTERKASA